MLQHTSSCDGRRNSTFWISCFEALAEPGDSLPRPDRNNDRLGYRDKIEGILKRRAENST